MFETRTNYTDRSPWTLNVNRDDKGVVFPYIAGVFFETKRTFERRSCLERNIPDTNCCSAYYRWRSWRNRRTIVIESKQGYPPIRHTRFPFGACYTDERDELIIVLRRVNIFFLFFIHYYLIKPQIHIGVTNVSRECRKHKETHSVRIEDGIRTQYWVCNENQIRLRRFVIFTKLIILLTFVRKDSGIPWISPWSRTKVLLSTRTYAAVGEKAFDCNHFLTRPTLFGVDVFHQISTSQPGASNAKPIRCYYMASGNDETWPRVSDRFYFV